MTNRKKKKCLQVTVQGQEEKDQHPSKKIGQKNSNRNEQKGNKEPITENINLNLQ